MLVDISLINLDNINEYQRELYKRQKRGCLSKKEYQHKYYLEVTKQKRKMKKVEE